MMSLLRHCRLSSKLQKQIGRKYAPTSYHIFDHHQPSPIILRNSHISRVVYNSISTDIRCAQQTTQKAPTSYHIFQSSPSPSILPANNQGQSNHTLSITVPPSVLDYKIDVSRSSNSSVFYNNNSTEICTQQTTQRRNLSYYTKHHLPFRDCRRLDEAVKMMYDYLPNANDRNLSAFWSAVPRLLGTERNIEEMNDQLDHILDHTLEEMQSFGYRDLAQTALAFAKIIKSVGMRVPPSGTPHRLMYDRFIDINGRKKDLIFNTVASRSIEILDQFDERHLSNLIYANGLVRHFKTEDGSEIFDILALQAAKLHNFNGQDLSNMLWAYAHVKVPNSTLFQEAGDSIVGLENLNDFKAQEVANIIWSYATLNEHHPQLFEKVADHILQLPGLGKFKPQELANLVWAYSTANESNHQLFGWMLYKKVADHIVGLDRMDKFKPQELSNILLAYAKAGEEYPGLFEKVANHIVMGRLESRFNEQDVSNTVWAFAKVNESHRLMFILADHIITLNKSGRFSDEQGFSNTVWAYATNGLIDHHLDMPSLFSSLEHTAKENLDKFTHHGLANVAWAYSVANVDAPSVFNNEFINACLRKEDEFTSDGLSQLHQWQLWQEEIKSDISLPSSLQKRCYEAFVSQEVKPSKLQDDIVSILSSIGLQPQEEVLLKSGYRIDAVVEVDGQQVAVEVDGPSHFIGKDLTGSTILKHRQVASLDGMQVVSVPHWEWNEHKDDSEKKKRYLQSRLDFEIN